MTHTTFTVAMPAYNAAATIAASIRSVLAQTRHDFELIVVDDGSEDGTAQIAASFTDPRVRVVTQRNAGPGAARNRGIVEGSGPYVSMLDSDDLWLPGYLEAMAVALDNAPDAGLAYTDAWVLDDRTGRIRRTTAMAYQHPPIPPPEDPREFLRLLIERRNFVFTSATVRRAALEEVGLFDTAPRPSEDYEMWLRIVARGFRAVRTPTDLAVYRKRRGSLSTDEVGLLRGEREALRLVAEEYAVPDEIRAVARRHMRRLDNAIAARTGGRGLMPALERVRGRAVLVKQAITEPFMWHRRPPAAIADVLAAANADGQDARADAYAAPQGDRTKTQDAAADT